MKKRILLLTACMLLAVALWGMGSAEATLSAARNGNQIDVRWSGCSGSCVLTVYINGWPCRVCEVQGEAGQARLTVEADRGACSVRLKTPNGCLTCDAAEEGGPSTVPTEPAVTPVPTMPQTSVAPTNTPAPTATPEPTKKPVPTATTKPVLQETDDGRFDERLAAQVIDQVNAERAKQGLKPLVRSDALTRAATVRAGEIVLQFSHTRPDGTSWSTVSSSAYGENIAKGQRTADKVMAAWMTSSGHRANILRESYGSIGVCAYVHGGVVYWVQLFGK